VFVIVWDDWGMARGYRPVLRDQLMLLPPDMRDWLGAGHPVWVVIEVCRDHLDLRAVHAARRAGGRGAAGYDPAMLAALLVWAYAHRVTSSRQIERLCRTDVAFRVICGGGAGPDHVTVARFRAGLGPAAGDMFASVLALCARLGMGQLGTVALDGTKIKANASKDANRTEEQLRELAAGLAAAHAAADAAEDDLFGPGARGDELPPDLADPQTRAGRIAAALAELEAERQAAEQDQQDKSGRQRAEMTAREERVAGLVAAQAAKAEDFERRNAAKIAASGRGLKEGRPTPPDRHVRIQLAVRRLAEAQRRAAAAGPAGAEKEEPRPARRNSTDPHSRLMPVRGGGFIQGYNAQVVTTADGLIIATELTTGTGDVTCFDPMLRQAESAAALMAAHRPPGPGYHRSEKIGLILADAGYLSEDNLTTPGPDRLIATGKNHDLQHTATAPRRAGGTAHGTAALAMAARLTDPGTMTAYKQRSHIAETPNAHIKHNMGIRQLHLRGTPRATAEWTLITTVHNIFKAITTGHLTPSTLAALPA
jgi:transposase